MTEHSALNQADVAIDIGTHAPCRTQADYDATMEILVEAERTLTNTYLGGQEPDVPHDWKIQWYECRLRLQALDKAITKLNQRLRASQFFAGQKRRDKAIAKEKASLSKNWVDLDGFSEVTEKDQAGNIHVRKDNLGERQFLALKASGFDVRQIGSGKFQFATRS